MKSKTELTNTPAGSSEEAEQAVAEAADYRAERLNQKQELLAKRPVANKSQGNDEYEQGRAEDGNVDIDGLIAEEAFLSTSRRDFEVGDRVSDYLEAEAKVNGFAMGSVTERRNEARNDRRNESAKDRRIGAP